MKEGKKRQILVCVEEEKEWYTWKNPSQGRVDGTLWEDSVVEREGKGSGSSKRESKEGTESSRTINAV